MASLDFTLVMFHLLFRNHPLLLRAGMDALLVVLVQFDMLLSWGGGGLFGGMLFWSKLLIRITPDLLYTDTMNFIVCAYRIYLCWFTSYYTAQPSQPELDWGSLAECRQSYKHVGSHSICFTPVGLWPNFSKMKKYSYGFYLLAL